MKFTEILTCENIRQGMIFSSKKRLFEALAEFAEQRNEEQPEETATSFECLFKREKLGNSGLGQGIAMPKGKLSGISSPIVVFMQLSSPIDYGAPDGKEVDLIFALFVPAENSSQYVPLFTELAQKLLDKNLLKQLRSAQNAQAIWQIFQFADKQQEQDMVTTLEQTEE